MADGDSDRRQEPRREEDRVVALRLNRLEDIVNKFELTLQGLGSAVGHLALLDARADENRLHIDGLEKRMDQAERNDTDIRIVLEGLKTRVLFLCALGSLLGSGIVGLLLTLAR